MAGKISGSSDEPIAEINIVPFVDIILVVLIIFMVTTPLIMKPSLNVNLPSASTGDQTSASELSIAVNTAGQIFLNGKESNDQELKSYAEELAKKTPDVQAVVSADKDVAHGKVVAVIDTVKAAGVKRFAITIDKKK